MPAIKGRAQRPHSTPRSRGDDRWQMHAACVDANPSIFFDPDRYTDALAVCAQCPVKDPCRELGQEQPAGGVWGGLVHQGARRGERFPIQKVSPPHGTDARYSQHRREGEEPCTACVAAHSAKWSPGGRSKTRRWGV